MYPQSKKISHRGHREHRDYKLDWRKINVLGIPFSVFSVTSVANVGILAVRSIQQRLESIRQFLGEPDTPSRIDQTYVNEISKVRAVLVAK
jgi:hypothetical protein